jgi:NAD+ synthase (glutamine-hydrolysing)
MPGFGTSERTLNNVRILCDNLGLPLEEIDITEACELHLKQLGHEDQSDTCFENTQARERTQILMNKANQIGGMVIGTGDMSELALGWCTYNGDHMSMYAVNCSIPKTLVAFLIEHVAETETEGVLQKTLLDILDTPISPELLPPDQQGVISHCTEELVGPYELHDFFLFNLIRCGFAPDKVFHLACHAFSQEYDRHTIRKWLKSFIHRFFTHQFKRSCIPDGPKVGTLGLSPRGDWRMPSDAGKQLWLTSIPED